MQIISRTFRLSLFPIICSSSNGFKEKAEEKALTSHTSGESFVLRSTSTVISHSVLRRAEHGRKGRAGTSSSSQNRAIGNEEAKTHRETFAQEPEAGKRWKLKVWDTHSALTPLQPHAAEP